MAPKMELSVRNSEWLVVFLILLVVTLELAADSAGNSPASDSGFDGINSESHSSSADTGTDDVIHRRFRRSTGSDDIRHVMRAVGWYMRHHKFHGLDLRHLQLFKGNTVLEEQDWFSGTLDKPMFMRRFPDPPLESLDRTMQRECERGVKECLLQIYKDGPRKLYGAEADIELTFDEDKWFGTEEEEWEGPYSGKDKSEMTKKKKVPTATLR